MMNLNAHVLTKSKSVKHAMQTLGLKSARPGCPNCGKRFSFWYNKCEVLHTPSSKGAQNIKPNLIKKSNKSN